MDQHEEVETIKPDASAEQMGLCNEKIVNLEARLAEIKARERDSVLHTKVEMEDLRHRTKLDVERVHKFTLEEFVNELLSVLDNLDRILGVADRGNDAIAAMVEGIELTRRSALDVVTRFGVQMVANIDVPMGPNVRQAIVMVEFSNAAAGNVLMVMQKGCILNRRTTRATMVSIAKARG